MTRRGLIMGGTALLAAVGGGIGYWWRGRAEALPKARPPASAADFAAAHHPIPTPQGPMSTYHLGHSLVGRDMPAMLAQMAGHTYHSQLGWGSSLRNHWQGPEHVNGYDAENAHSAFRPAREGLQSGQYDVVVLTEMVELRDAIAWHASPHYLAQWAVLAREANPAVRLYLYESWHALDTAEGWEVRIAKDLPELWEGTLLRGALAWGGPALSLIPAGQVMAAATAAAQSGALPEVTDRAAFFATTPEGKPDLIHPSPLGSYLVALTHYAVIYQRSPEGLPAQLTRIDGPPLDLSPALAAALQKLVWEVVSRSPFTGIAP